MIKYMIKRKVKNEMLDYRTKIAIYTGISLASTAGVYFSYKTIKKIKKKQKNDIQDLECKNDKINVLENDSQQNELKEKIEEFNSRRICSDNSEDSSPKEMDKYINSIKDYKKDIKINENEYKIDEYEKYEDDIEK